MTASATSLRRRARVWTRAEMWVALAVVSVLAVAAVVSVVVAITGPLTLWSSATTSGTSSSTTSLGLEVPARGPLGVALQAAAGAGVVVGCAALWLALLPRATGRHAHAGRLARWKLGGLRAGAIAAVGAIAITLAGPLLGVGDVPSILLELYAIDCYARTAQESGQWLFFRRQTN